jgi:hypothetical protein
MNNCNFGGLDDLWVVDEIYSTIFYVQADCHRLIRNWECFLCDRWPAHLRSKFASIVRRGERSIHIRDFFLLATE